jgi:RNA polymerase sigma-70 factor (ECF subfamily)
VSSSLSAARFPAFPLRKESEATEPLCKDTVAPAAELSDETLIARICAGDTEALGLLFRRYARLVWSVAERILRDKDEADDVLQDVFVLIQRKASIFDSSKGTPRSLIVHMTYQRAFTRRRYLGARHFQCANDVEQNESKMVAPIAPFYDETIEAHFGRDGLRRALADMSEDQRETLRLYFFEGYTLEEIALHLGQSAGNIRHHYYRGLDKLRKHMPKK